ncbi:MAG: hypothetical protein KatS3mg057_0853 [Herpetosiphonaceae bacterium]|nr:MAG: hypothetical protein KatS3mg057_0853 [Herpetosiphonaceae bacterium]
MAEAKVSLEPAPLLRDQPDTKSLHIWPLLGLIAGLRAITSILGLLLFGFVTYAASNISLWPPGDQLALWFDRFLVKPWLRWDANFYVRIAGDGYLQSSPSLAFHPLYPMLGRSIAALLGIHPLPALLILSTFVTAALLPLFERLALLDLDAQAALRSTILLALSPVSFVLLAPYSEGLFLLITTLALFWSRQGRWWLAGLAGFGAALTRQQGVVLALPILWEMAARIGWRGLLRRPAWWPTVVLPPMGMVLFIIYRAVIFNDVSIDWSSPNAIIYSLLISPDAQEVASGQRFLLPLHVLWLALQSPYAPLRSVVIDLGLGIGFVLLLLFGWRQLRPSYRIYSLAIVLLAFSYYNGHAHPLMALPRHLLLAVPLFMPLGVWVNTHRRLLLLLVVFIAGYISLLGLYFLNGWVP